MQKLEEFIAENRAAFEQDLCDLLRIPSISTDSQYHGEVRKAAEWVANQFRSLDLNTEIIETVGQPLVYAETPPVPGKPVALVYGHYDVQPPDPLDEWLSPPFEPEIRNDNIYARGAVDDKGQVYLVIKAIEALLAVYGSLPVNIKFLVEGEEETDGGVLRTYLEEHGGELGADAALVCDTDMFAPGLPTLCTGLRGLVYAEIEVRGARTDLHSGMYGGVAPNPFQGLAEILSGLKDREGRIVVPGIYEQVTPPSDAEREAWANLPFDEDEMREAEIGSKSLVGEPGKNALERIWARPTFEVHGMPGGFTGHGAKTVIPAKATAKVSMRLVPDIDADRAADALVAAVQALEPAGMTATTRIMAKAPASMTSTDSVFIQKAAEALEETFEKKTVYVRSGGSIPVVGLFQEHAGIPSVLMGFGLPDDNLHAPNEKFHIPNFHSGTRTVARYLQFLGED